jgi:L,D-transpeptidase ErfK/SrfK
LAACGSLQNFLAGDSASETQAAAPPEPRLHEQPKLEPINRNYFMLDDAGQSVVGELQVVFTREDETFSDLAREYGLGYDELLAANPDVDPWLPGADTPLLLPTQYVLPDAPREGVVLNIAAKRLFYYPAVVEGEAPVVMTFPIGIGRVGWETPLGETTVISKATDPHWYVPASVREEHAEMGDPLPSVVPPGPDNPLGKHVLKLDLPGYLIHGTNQPYGVGMRVSHGCVRLYPENIELLYSLVELGENVHIVNQPYLAGYLDGDLFFEGHAPLQDDAVSADDRLQAIIAANELIDSEDAVRILQGIAGEARGIPVRLASVQAGEAFAGVRVVRNTFERDPDEPTLEEVRALLDEEDTPASESKSDPEPGSAPAADETVAPDRQAMDDEDDGDDGDGADKQDDGPEPVVANEEIDP